ncbi:MAG: hypothetical protein IPF54_23860 [Draconibacterium sp.]|nr:hypothetical protein [Draconibacterium sp.]
MVYCNRYLRFETDVVITESNKVYINIEGLFRNLGIKCISGNESGVLTGFIENESKTYRIDFNSNQITIGEKIIRAANGFMKESGAIYIESTVITEAFGLQIIFNYRSLSIKLESDFELPVIKQMRLEQMRQNVSKLQDKRIVADTIIQRDYHFLKFGTMDWSISSFQTTGEKTNNRFYFGLGTELLYGQFNVSAEYNDQYKFDKRRIDYNWRWVDNGKNAIKQAQLGKIYNQSISFLEAPLVGAAVSNAPTTLRKASGFYNINEYTEPNWTVELYLNDILVDFTRQMLFLPAKSLEYSVSGGVLQDYKNSRFGKGVVNYGISNFLTLGAGVEYLSSIEVNPYIPYANLAFQPFGKLILNLEYAHNVRSKGLMKSLFWEKRFWKLIMPIL